MQLFTTVQVKNRISCNNLRDGARDLFCRIEEKETEVLGTWQHIVVHDLCVTDGANGSSGRTTRFACSGTSRTFNYCWGLTC